jgi:hypothetical protein
MPVRRRQCRQLCRLAKAFPHLVQRRIGFATGLRQRIKIAHHGFDNVQRINGLQHGVVTKQPFRLAPHRIDVFILRPGDTPSAGCIRPRLGPKTAVGSVLGPGQLPRRDGSNQEAVGPGSFVVKVTCGSPAIGGRPRSAAGGGTEPPTPPNRPPSQSICAPRAAAHSPLCPSSITFGS